MDTRLDCEIIRDLLPSYADGLTGGVTNRAVEAHLENCTECSEALLRMREPECKEQPPAPEVDYLKKVRRRTGYTAVLFAAGAVVLIIMLLCIRLFALGSEVDPTGVNYSASVSGNTVYFNGSLRNTESGVSRISFTQDGGVVTVSLYTAPKSFLNRAEFSKQYEAESAVTQIRFGGLIVWENGMEISRTAAQLYAAKNPYVGDMSSNSRIATILGVSDQLGSYTNELQTSTEPYGWTLRFNIPITEDEETARNIMTADAYAMLAAINNLGYVTWEYQAEKGRQVYTIKAEDASAFAGQDIKLCAETASDLQVLVQSLSIKWAGVRESLQESGTFRLSIANESDAKISELVIHYYLNGRLIGSQSSENANGSAFSKGSTTEFAFMPKNFPEGTNADGLLSGFSFDLEVVGKDGSTTPVCEGRSVKAKYAWTYFFTLSGNDKDGFILNEG